MLIISVILLLNLSFNSSYAAENGSLSTALAQLHKTLLTHEKETIKLGKELSLSLGQLQKIKGPSESQTQAIQDLLKASNLTDDIQNSINLTRQYAKSLADARKNISHEKEELKKPIDYLEQQKVNKLPLKELNRLNNQVALENRKRPAKQPGFATK